MLCKPPKTEKLSSRETFLKKEVRKAAFDHIRENAEAEEIYIEDQETHDQKRHLGKRMTSL